MRGEMGGKKRVKVKEQTWLFLLRYEERNDRETHLLLKERHPHYCVFLD